MSEVRPVRLQLSRKSGFNLHDHSQSVNGLPARRVTRPSEFGNPFRITGPQKYLDGSGKVEWWVETDASVWRFDSRKKAQAAAVEMFRHLVGQKNHEGYRDRVRLAFKGMNVACFCKPGEPCHADVLLEIANPKGD